ncbi:MAG: alpha/beta hydrolase [Bacteroidota bacterium]
MKTFIEVEGLNMNRPSERPSKSNWKIEMIKKGLGLLQYASARKSAEIIWHYFTMPGKTKFTQNQLDILRDAEINQMSYKGDIIKTYQWGITGPKVLLCHGWRSKTADFRKMIIAFRAQGYLVEGLDLRAHGNSQGTHTALPEYRDILKSYIAKNGPYNVIIGYSIGGLASGVALSELGEKFQPNHFFVIASPPYARYLFKDLIQNVGCNKAVYESICQLVKEIYDQPIDYFDLRIKQQAIKNIDTHLLYCEDDQIIAFQKGLELEECWSHASFVHAKGLGHYRIIANEAIIDYILGKTNC